MKTRCEVITTTHGVKDEVVDENSETSYVNPGIHTGDVMIYVGVSMIDVHPP